MTFSIAPQIFEKFPALVVGLLAVRGASNTGAPPEIGELLRSAEAAVRAVSGIDPVNQHPRIAAWREAHRTFGNNPNDFPPSLQAVVRRVVKGKELPRINPLVDLYNAISLKYLVPAGGEDLGRCEGDIELTFATGNEEFVELGGTQNDPPLPGEVIYRDARGVICRRFNWREADRTKFTEETKNALLVLECLSSATREELERALHELQEHVQRFCGGTSTIALLDGGRASCGL